MQHVGSPDILEQRTRLIDSVPENTLDQIADTRRRVRERAIYRLTQGLDPNSDLDRSTFQRIPLEFLERGDFSGAIWYIETVVKNGVFISWEIIRIVVLQTMHVVGLMVRQSDNADAKIFSQSLFSLLQMASRHPIYKDIPELYLLIGNLSEISRNDRLKAIPHYNKATELGLTEGYLASAEIYRAKGLLNESVSILSRGYEASQDTRILTMLIFNLFLAGKKDQAMAMYDNLKKKEGSDCLNILLYKGFIENDNELLEAEEIIASYLSQKTYMPLESIERLSRSVSDYILDGITRENKIIQDMDLLWQVRAKNKTKTQNIDDEFRKQYADSFQKQLLYMQIDILTLGKERFIDAYIKELRNFGLEGDHSTRKVLQNFFDISFSKEVARVESERSKKEKEETLKEAKKDGDLTPGILMVMANVPESNKPISVFERLSLHVSRIGELFYQQDLYEFHEKYIVPFLRDSAIMKGEYDADMEDAFSRALKVLKSQHDNYTSLFPETRDSYSRLVMEFDKKYGVLFRRHLQNLAINPDIDEPQYPNILMQYPDIGFFFFLERILYGQIEIDDTDELIALVDNYGLYNVDITDALLFGSILYNLSAEFAITYFVNYSGMLDSPQALYIITEGLRFLVVKERKAVIRSLNGIVAENYGVSSFFEHIRSLFVDIESSSMSDEDAHYILLTNGNIAALQKKGLEEEILNFQTASSGFDSIEGSIKAGDALGELKRYKEALTFYEEAFDKTDNILVTTRIISSAILVFDYSKAQKYIDFAVRRGYEVGNYILALHLWQGREKDAYLQVISMIKAKNEPIDSPLGLYELLVDTINFTLSQEQTSSLEDIELRIHASFILQNLSFNGVEQNPIGILTHWRHIIALCDSLNGDELHGFIEKVLRPMTGDSFLDSSDPNLSPSDISIMYLHEHADNCHKFLGRMLKDSWENQNGDAINAIFNARNFLCQGVAFLLKRFPDSENYVQGWNKGIMLSKEVPKITSESVH